LDDQKYIVLIITKSFRLAFDIVPDPKILAMVLSILFLFVFIPQVYAEGVHQESLYNTINSPFVIDKNYHIDVGKNSSSIGLHYNRSNNVDFVYVANYLDNTVSVISINNNSKIKDIPVGDGPVAFAELGNYVYVANYQNNSVSVIDSFSLEKIDDLVVGKGPKSMAVDGEFRVIYVANYLDNSISEIYEEGGNTIREISVGRGPIALIVVWDSGDNNVYVANYLDNSVSIINGSSFTQIKDFLLE
jgi:YVTN family beta-propeller protein